MFNKIQPYIELVFLTSTILILYFVSMEHSTTSLCVFKCIGFTKCWGCGIGHAMQSALHGNFKASFQQHFAGIPAVILFLFRIAQLIIHNIKYPNNYELFKRNT